MPKIKADAVLSYSNFPEAVKDMATFDGFFGQMDILHHDIIIAKRYGMPLPRLRDEIERHMSDILSRRHLKLTYPHLEKYATSIQTRGL